MTYEWGSTNSEGTAAERPLSEEIELDAVLVVAGERVRTTVVALSPTEIHLRSAERLIAGETVEVELGGVGYALVRICWSKDGEAGGTFLDFE